MSNFPAYIYLMLPIVLGPVLEFYLLYQKNTRMFAPCGCGGRGGQSRLLYYTKQHGTDRASYPTKRSCRVCLFVLLDFKFERALKNDERVRIRQGRDLGGDSH